MNTTERVTNGGPSSWQSQATARWAPAEALASGGGCFTNLRPWDDGRHALENQPGEGAVPSSVRRPDVTLPPFSSQTYLRNSLGGKRERRRVESAFRIEVWRT